MQLGVFSFGLCVDNAAKEGGTVKGHVRCDFDERVAVVRNGAHAAAFVGSAAPFRLAPPYPRGISGRVQFNVKVSVAVVARELTSQGGSRFNHYAQRIPKSITDQWLLQTRLQLSRKQDVLPDSDSIPCLPDGLGVLPCILHSAIASTPEIGRGLHAVHICFVKYEGRLSDRRCEIRTERGDSNSRLRMRTTIH